MPYTSISQLPKPVKKLPKKLQRMFMHVFNYTYQRTNGDEAKSFKIAWGVVKKHLKKQKKKIVKKHLSFTPLKFKSAKTLNGDVFIDFIMTAEALDKQGQVVTKELISKLSSELNKQSIFGDIEHARLYKYTGDSLLSLPLLELLKVTQVDDKLFGTARLLKSHPYSSQVLDMIRNNKLNGISIEIAYDSDDLVGNRFVGGSVIGFTLTQDPALQDAQILRIREGVAS